MAQKNTDKNLLDLKQFGVCMKDSDGQVVYQNELCRHICGDVQSTHCHACQHTKVSKIRRFVNDFLLRQGFYWAKNVSICDHPVDLMRIQDRDKTVTYLQPLANLYEQYETVFEEAGLTEKEAEIAHFVVQGRDNNAIANRLFISRSTLKTHLNNIYRKAPFLKTCRGST